MQSQNLSSKGPTIILAVLITIGAALRMGGLFSPLTHDELSAICRLQFDDFSDLLTNGVKPDGHPAGVEVFMWLWVQLFGQSAVAIRFPFMLMGIFSVPLIYGIARRWYGRWSSMLPTAAIAVSQYTVYYSDIARPYCVGLFFILCALYMLTCMITDRRYTVWRLVLFAVFEACCAYTHYFCMLTAVLMAFAALFFIDRRHILSYLVACTGAALLFVPHIKITLYQLFELKGVGGWLGKPTPFFALEYFRYLTHHSLLAAIVCLVAFLLLFSFHAVQKNKSVLVASLVIGLLPLIIGYVYSVTVSPVLQFSVLIFSFPFLLLSFAACIDDRRRALLIVFTVVYVITMVTTLFFTRHHYTMLSKEWIEASVHEAKDATLKYGGDNVACLFNLSPCKVAYYDSTLNLMPQELASDASRLDSALARCPQPYLICSGIQDPSMLAVVNRHYPFLLRAKQCVVSEICLFGRQPSSEAICVDSLAYRTYEQPLQVFDDEYFVILDTILGDIVDSRFVCVESNVQFMDSTWNEESKPIYLVTELLYRDHPLDWRSVTLVPTIADSVSSVLLPVRVEGTIKHRSHLKHARVKVYLWNPDRNTHTIPCRCRIRLLPTSPWIYSVLEEI